MLSHNSLYQPTPLNTMVVKRKAARDGERSTYASEREDTVTHSCLYLKKRGDYMTLSQIAEIITSKAVREINDDNISPQVAKTIFSGISILITRMHYRREINNEKYNYCVSIITTAIANKERSYKNE